MKLVHRRSASALAKRAHTAAAIFLLFAAQSAFAGTFRAFGPAMYTRETSTPQEQHVSFAVRNPAAPYRLHVENALVASAVVKVNGVTVFSPNDFNAAKAAVLEASVALANVNDLSVELRSNPGSTLTVTVLGEDNDLPTITGSVSPAPNASGWANSPVTVTFTCADRTTDISQCTAPVTLSSDGANQAVAGTAVDGAGNSASTTVHVNIDRTGPSIALTNPPASASTATLSLSGTITDSGSGPAKVTCNGAPAVLSGTSFQCSVTLASAFNIVNVDGTDAAGNSTRQSAAVLFDQQAPSIRINAPADGATVPTSTFVVTGLVTDNDSVASVKIGNSAATLSGSQFSGQVTLAEGSNTITVTALDRAGNPATAAVHLNRFSIPAVAITAPADQALVRTATVTISGTVSDPAASVRVNGVNAAVSGATWHADGVALQQGRTVVTATATNAAGHVATATIYVFRDSIPPRLTVYAPAEGTTVYQPAVDVTGMVDDIVVGTINAGQASITVNGAPAEVANRAFEVRDVALVPGPNTINVTATDQGGNTTSVALHVTYDAAARAKIVKVSGDNQRGLITSTLPQPLVVRLVDAAGTPQANRAVTFQVVENNGSLTAGDATARTVTVPTNAQGTASTVWHLGSRAGAGNNRVVASATGFAGSVEFDATAASGTPTLIVVDGGSNQIGALGTALPRPLSAAVVDSGSNRIAGVPVTFTVADGDATFSGAPSVTVNTDSDGRAWATPTLGSVRDYTFIASIGANKPAVFVVTGKAAGPAGQTSISGVVLDNENQPIAGVSMRVEGTTLVTQTNAQGQFNISGAPVGYVKLIADGSTAQRSGTWPMLEYQVFTVAGQNNTLEMPVYLLPIDVRRGVFVDETTGGTLTIPELPGFALTIAPGSATFPGGSRTGTVSATLVHLDKVPMAPGFGQQPRFIVTIQPPGTHFDPPAALTIPNADGLAPGEVTEMYSFDHDLGQFVSIGTGSVSEDGAVIRSDPGVGIIKGGWHCGGNPATSGATANCPECRKCNGTTCVTDAAKESKPCKDDGDPSTEDVCENGTCVHKPISVAIGGPGASGSSTDFRNLYVDRDDPSKSWSDAVQLNGQRVYGSQGIEGDFVIWRAYISNESMRNRVTNYRWNATGADSITGPGGAAAKEWSQPTGISWKPGTYTITLEVTFDNGLKKTATMTQEVGVRTQDVLVIGWINGDHVPLSDSGVYLPLSLMFPTSGLGINASLVQQAAALTYLGTVSFGNDDRPFGPLGNKLSATDRHYLLNWLFKFAPNPHPPDYFFAELEVSAFKALHVVYKLYNRAQVKYFVAGGKITDVTRIHKEIDIGWTIDPITGIAIFPGEAGPANERFVVTDTEIHQINDGTPEHMAVAAFNTLMTPRIWNNIGSKVMFSLAALSAGDVKNQLYPTYNIYVTKSIVALRDQAPDPSGNFNTTPYPPGPPYPPYIYPQ
jgi:hypothetical protein